MLRDELLATAARLTEQLDRVAAEMRTLSDPDAAAAQIETVTAEATERVATAEAARGRAESAARDAAAQAGEADAAAGELEQQLQATTDALAEAEQAHRGTLAELESATGTIDSLTAQLAAVTTGVRLINGGQVPLDALVGRGQDRRHPGPGRHVSGSRSLRGRRHQRRGHPHGPRCARFTA